jgi:hypothetical protein
VREERTVLDDVLVLIGHLIFFYNPKSSTNTEKASKY